MITYVCARCGALVNDPTVDSIDPGTTLTCSEPDCEGDTVVDLDTPAERARRFALAERAPHLRTALRMAEDVLARNAEEEGDLFRDREILHQIREA